MGGRLLSAPVKLLTSDMSTVNVTAPNLFDMHPLMPHCTSQQQTITNAFYGPSKSELRLNLFNSNFAQSSRNKMLKRQTNKLITVECFLTLHSPISFRSLPRSSVIY